MEHKHCGCECHSKKIYQGEPVVLNFRLRNDNDNPITNLSKYKITIVVSRRNIRVKAWSNYGAKDTDEITSPKKGYFQGFATPEETSAWLPGEYTVELRVSENNLPAIALARDVFTLEHTTIKEVPNEG